MVTVKHKQTGLDEYVSITTWLNKYNHDLWEVLEIKDAVDLFSLKKGVWELHNTVEEDAALDIIRQHPNDFRYEPSVHNTAKTNKEMNKSLVKLDELLLEAEKGMIFLTEDSSDEYDNLVYDAVEKGFLKEVNKSVFKITSKGTDVLLKGGYEKWSFSQKSRGEKITLILRDAERKGLISLTKDDNQEYTSLVHYIFDKGLFTEIAKSTYRLSAKGHDALDAGGYEHWLAQQRQPLHSTPVTNHYGHVINGSSIKDSDLSAHKSSLTTPKSQVTNKSAFASIPEWMKWAIATLIALPAALWAAYQLYQAISK
jgi:hypothetical protein